MGDVKKSYWDSGFGANIERAKKEAQKRQNRFYLKPDQSKTIVFLDDEPFCFNEHNPLLNGTYKDNWFICRSGMPDDPRCPLCQCRVKRYYVGFLSILDLDGYVNREGDEVKNIRCLFPMKLHTLEIMGKQKKKRGTLVGAKYEVSRSTNKNAAAVGDMFEFVGFVDLKSKEFQYVSKLDGKPHQPEPFDYKSIFKPLSYREMLGLGFGTTTDGDDDSDNDLVTSGNSADDDEDTLY